MDAPVNTDEVVVEPVTVVEEPVYINDPRAVKFVNEQIRTEADSLVSVYVRAKKLLAIWDNQGLAALIPPTPDFVEDGSPNDGRPPITGMQVNILVGGIRAMIEQVEAVSQTTGMPLLSVIYGVAVNY